MSWDRPQDIHRTALAFLAKGDAASPEAAEARLSRLVLQMHVGPTEQFGSAASAALCTIVNAGRRAFLGGIHVRLDEDFILRGGWADGQRASDYITTLGATLVDTLEPNYPTLVLGNGAAVGGVVLHPTWHGWCAGVVQDDRDRLDEHGLELAGVAAGALGVSETFQYVTGPPGPGRRDVGISLWDPSADWRSPEGAGSAVSYLPSKLWLLGLGHLGQGYAWSLGWLNYADHAPPTVGLVDFDEVEAGNRATSMLLVPEDEGSKKVSVLERELKARGFKTIVVQRRFDKHFYPQVGEPTLALAGFDKPEPRQLLGDRFSRVVDGGLGTGPTGYLSIQLHTFPSPLSPEEVFTLTAPERDDLSPVYESVVKRLIAEGQAPGTARCGVTMVSGLTVAAAFVGAFTGSLVIADVLRRLHGGAEICMLRCDLRTPTQLRCSENPAAGPPSNEGFVVGGEHADSEKF
jgi:hypothetical protein